MSAITSPTSYDHIAKSFHWVIALLIVCMLACGWIMGDLPKGTLKFVIFQTHKSFGILILALSLLRVFWRISHVYPALPQTMATWEIVISRITHGLFYVLMIGMPLSGWALVSASPLNIPTILFGVLPWPHLPYLAHAENKKELAHLLGDVHGAIAFILAGLLVLHIGAALKHHFVVRDDVLRRMLPHCFLRPTPSSKNP